ncbi:MAG TPA: SRPBCC family protein [Gemmatimonadota bacterium]|nr:SRPBCC family protein [Gemmatimonadota bacterium]
MTGPVVDPDIRRASTLPSRLYTDADLFAAARERVFARSWQLAAPLDAVRTPRRAVPVTLLEGFLDEPLLLTRDDEDVLRCLSNVCTHRGNLVVEAETEGRTLRCRYHGRRFGLDGGFVSMPEFEGVEDFPSAADDLPRVPLATWGPLAFVALDPVVGFEEAFAPIAESLAFLPLDELVYDPAISRDYLVRAHWALYVDNYLEGFHVPYIHAGLADTLDYGAYRTETRDWAVLQVGVARGGVEAFDPVAGEERVAALYWWLFPNTMINVYPWGMSVNVVKPIAPDRTRVSYHTWVLDPARMESGAGAALDRVEREDEAIVEAVQRGVRSRYYDRGRYSPGREQGPHHFHRLLERLMDV